MSRRRLLVPALSTAAMFAVLLGLGAWQMQRRDWKHGLLEQIDAAERNPPVPLGSGLPQFAKVSAGGVLRGDLAVSYGAEVRDLHGAPVLGTQMVAPLERPDGPPVLVDLGWVQMPPAKLAVRTTTVEGYLRPSEHAGLFSAGDDPARRLFYTLDPAAIGAALGLRDVAPFVLVALGPPGSPDPARHLPALADNHLQYAVTWFSLAVVLLAVFILYVRKGKRA